MRLFAFFLPQFHEIPENNEWWSKGFTEWTNVRKAKPLFKGHIQPLHPLKDNYYNLLDKSTVEWQTRLMKEYGLTGMIYYHYYFCGKKLLEKPAENLLKWKDIDQPFFFCWANHSWKKTWNGTSELLVEQTYGNESDWEEHFQYLLPFFKDDRYEKRNNKPLFMYFDINYENREKMSSFFDKRCKESGFDGICIINTISKTNEVYLMSKHTDVEEIMFLREPSISLSILFSNMSNIPYRIFNRLKQKLSGIGIYKYDADVLLKKRMKYNLSNNDYIPGVFFQWDNTARHGNRGYYISSLHKDTFFRYMDLMKESEYLFINAWNEWCEGMILEPTEENGYKYLEWIKEWVDRNGRCNQKMD